MNNIPSISPENKADYSDLEKGTLDPADHDHEVEGERQVLAPVAGYTSGWERAEESYREGETLEAPVVGFNRGGLLIDLWDIRGFVPASQLVDFPLHIHDEERMNELARYDGVRLALKVIEIDRKHNRLILSERRAKLQGEPTKPRIEDIKPGQIIKGKVCNVVDYGAFVDLGGVHGLIHISEMSWQRTQDPRDVCTLGTELEVYVIAVDNQRGHVRLSLKRLHPDPWSLILQRYHRDDIVDVVITSVVSFGAFVRLPEGVEGLIHRSEMGEGGDVPPWHVVHEGQRVKVRILSIDSARQRVRMTLRLHAGGRAAVA